MTNFNLDNNIFIIASAKALGDFLQTSRVIADGHVPYKKQNYKQHCKQIQFFVLPTALQGHPHQRQSLVQG